MDLREGLAPVVDEWRPTLRAAGRPLKVRLPDGLLARVTPTRIREAVGALVDNALRHGGGGVTITGRTVDTSLVIEVADNATDARIELRLTADHAACPAVRRRAWAGTGPCALIEADGARLELLPVRPAMFTIFPPAARADDVVGAPRPARTTG
jgi:hypothetical protein